jgi:probable biosynthetic protein (TIGR04098 family)
MRIGKDCKISSSAKLDLTNPKGIVIGDNTAISFRTSILSHDFINGLHPETRIGSNCFIGACSVIMPGVSIGDHAIVGTGSVVFTDVPDNCVVSGNPARIVERDIVTGRWGIRNPAFLKQEGIQLRAAESTTGGPRGETLERPAGVAGSPEAMASYFGALPLDTPFSDSPFDSFALIALRAEIEENEGIQIADEDWINARRPIDLKRFITRPKAGTIGKGGVLAATARRSLEINMPQMSQKGLSEAWLFKEMGDIHWSLITGALKVKSNAIADQEGNRLYATFTRIRYQSTIPLSEFRENAPLDFSAGMTRFGAGMFFSTIKAETSNGKATFELMSSFSKFNEEGNAKSLKKGQPTIPPGFVIPSVAQLPQFAEEYRALRAEPAGDAIFSTDYEIVPVHDINGVGLLYFAAYPIITEICTQRYVDKGVRLSPIGRDISYYANSASDDAVRFILSEWTERDGMATAVAHLIRGDETRMATVRTVYALG